MCESCGCGETDDFTVRKPGEEMADEHHNEHHHEHDHEHNDDDKHVHHHEHEKDHHHGNSYERSSPTPRAIDISKDILSENNLTAERNRGFFEGRSILCLNLVSAPGSGKTTLLEKTIKERRKEQEFFVIEGDQQSMNDAERIRKTGVPVVQINTGAGCHLDARMVNSAIKRLELSRNSVLFVENVGNLVCPALFDLGETKRVVVMSVTEGEDKPEKYPYMFASSHLCIINKTDLLPYVDFNVEKAMEYARRTNPALEIILMSAKTGEGMHKWYEWIDKNQ
jgi:hydrogenase nickel incorporation protein HypB